MKSLMRGSVVVVCLSLFAVAGCGAAADPRDAAAEEEATGRTRAAIDTVDEGPLAVLGEAFAEVPLEKAQRADIEKLFEQAAKRHEPVRDARVKAASALAAQVERGRIDRDSLAPLFADVDQRLDAVRGDDMAALGKLHALLDQNQRGALVDALEARFEEMKPGPGGKRERMHEVIDRLQLSEAQVDSIKSGMRSKMMGAGPGGFAAFRKQMHRGKEALDAFRGDSFDPEKLASPSEMKEQRERGRGMMLDVVEVALPELTEKQRGLAAGLIRERLSDLSP